MARYSQATGVDTFSGGSGDGQGSMAGGPGDDSIEGDAAMDAAAFFSKFVDFYFRLTPSAQDGVSLEKVSGLSDNGDGVDHFSLLEAPRLPGASTGSADPTRTHLASAFGHMAVAPTKVLPSDLDSNIDNKICKESERSVRSGSAPRPRSATSCLPSGVLVREGGLAAPSAPAGATSSRGPTKRFYGSRMSRNLLLSRSASPPSQCRQGSCK